MHSFGVSPITAYIDLLTELDRQRDQIAPIALAPERETEFATKLEQLWQTMTDEQHHTINRWLRARRSV